MVDNNLWQIVRSPKTSWLACLMCLYLKNKPMTARQIAQMSNFGHNLIAGALLSLESEELVQSIRAKWVLTDTGQALMASSGLDRDALRQWIP